MEASSARVGGLILLGAGLVGIVGGLMHGPQPESVEALAAADVGRWNTSHIAIALAGALFTIGAFVLHARFAGSNGEGWSLIGTGTLLLTGIATLMVGTFETVGFGHLLALAEGGGTVAAEHAYQAVMAVMSSMSTAASFVFPVAAAAFGLGMLGAGEPWPRWMGWSGAVIGVVVLLLELFGVALPGAAGMAPFVLLNAWFAVAGALLFGTGRSAPRTAPSREPAQTF